jgi:hypothetical protein
MGIPKFFSYLSKNYSNAIKTVDSFNELTDVKKYDYVFIDYQSLCYSTLRVFSGEINYFIRLAHYIKYMAEIKSENIYVDYKHILDYIKNKYSRYFESISSTPISLPFICYNKKKETLSDIIKFMDSILDLPLKQNEHCVWDELVNQVIDLTKNIAETHIKDDKDGAVYSKTYIYFDGIPTMAKIKEQLSRRVYPDIIGTIKDNLYNKETKKELADAYSISKLNKKLLSDSAPIGIDTYIVNKLRTELSIIDDKKLGKFIINDYQKYGEAEHQLMKFLLDNHSQFKSKKILLVSPDADLILLSLISSTKEIYIDILRENAIDEKSYQFYSTNGITQYEVFADYIKSPYKKYYDYIDCEELKELIGLSTNQSILDISYLLLLLGDDFIPIISTLSIDDLPIIIKTYSDMISLDPLKIIIQQTSSKYILNYKNLKEFIELLSKQIKENPENIIKLIKEQNSIRIRNSRGIDSNFNKYIKWLFMDLITFSDFYKFKQLYYLENGYIPFDRNSPQIDLIKPKPELVNEYNSDLIEDYLKGCQFVFDIYLNNEVRNYKWYFKYEHAPTLTDITKYLSEIDDKKLEEKFDYYTIETPEKKAKYFDVAGYKRYIEDNKQKIINDVIKQIYTINKEQMPTNISYDDIKKLNLTYANVEKIFNCAGKKYFNKCIEATELVNPEDHITDILVDMLGGSYYSKYLKYKQKYLNLTRKSYL